MADSGMKRKATPESGKSSRGRDRFYVQADKHALFQRLSQGDDAPFRNMKDAWVLAAAMGFRAGRRQEVRGGRQHVGFWHYLSAQEDIPLLQALAVAVSGDIKVLADRGTVISIAEEYANGGVDLLMESERPDHASTIRALAATIVEQSNARAKVPSRGSEQPDLSARSSEDLIEQGESGTVEFKQTGRWNSRFGEAGAVDKALADTVLKTIAGFMNCRGGTLFIGVNDQGLATGLGPDYATFSGKHEPKDEFENWLTSILDERLGKAATARTAVRFEIVDGSEICRVDVRSSTKEPVFIDEHKTADFWVRLNNTTRQLNPKEAKRYIDETWG